MNLNKSLTKQTFHLLILVGILQTQTACNLVMKKIDLEYFNQNIASNSNLDASNSNLKVIDGILLENLDVSTSKIMSKKFTNCKWDNVNAVATEFINVEFNHCEINASSFQNSKFVNVTFHQCTIVASRFYNSDFIKVKFIKSTITDNKLDFFKGFSSLKNADVEFNESKLVNLTFFKSSGKFIFIKTKFIDSKAAALVAPSSMVFEDSFIEESDFSDSTLTSFIVKSSEIKNSMLNDATVDKVDIEDSQLDFAMAHSTFNTVQIKNVDNVILGDSNITNLTIENCKNDGDVTLSESKFKNISIRNCPLLLLDTSDAKGETLQISGMEIKEIDFSNFVVKNLIFNNVRLMGSVKFNNVMAEETKMTNVSISKGAKINMTGTNISFQ